MDESERWPGSVFQFILTNCIMWIRKSIVFDVHGYTYIMWKKTWSRKWIMTWIRREAGRESSLDSLRLDLWRKFEQNVNYGVNLNVHITIQIKTWIVMIISKWIMSRITNSESWFSSYFKPTAPLATFETSLSTEITNTPCRHLVATLSTEITNTPCRHLLSADHTLMFYKNCFRFLCIPLHPPPPPHPHPSSAFLSGLFIWI